ncbi:peptidoglycan-binding domain 1 protein [Moniliophthora roreri MCA 2997]|uniref:Peptidoglycan-binding domain 1 protein n=2 Tax=Moniliophthora roreri TaxID=221103 RepID=V2WE60_MONRO|nr:peptidoglycan-binding domain 1 protein [Moniliophthora roreri MCA 2997]KAI3603560.1 peptidoglycan-binding domain 1 protein [Moniliophthora roreri]
MSRTPLSQAQAEARLIPQGITASSTGRCTTRSNPSCTSYEGILSGTVDGVVGLKQAAGVSSLTITGGTEVGHAGGPYSHSKGCKVDIRHSSQLDNYIKTTFTKMTNRGDGYPQWRDAKGNTYCDEGHHWDVTYR